MKLLIILTILCVSCSSPIEYRPIVLGHDYKNLELVKPKRQGRIYCGDPEFQQYASVSLEDIATIATILKEAKVPWYMTGFLKDINKRLDNNLKELQP